MGTGRPLFAKLFLECKEVPFIGASVTHTVGQAAIAYVDLVPHKTINHIKPRTLVHLFIRDYSDPDNGYPWILMFEGEVFGISFSKTPDSRSFSISCIDMTGYWDNALMYFFNAQQSLGMSAQAAMQVGYATKSNSGNAQVTPITNSKATYFRTVIDGKLQEPGTDFLDGIVEVFKKFELINDFYSAAEDRLRITDRIALKSSGKLSELLTDTAALDWFSGMVGQESGFNTLRQAMSQLLGMIFHDHVTVPFPARVAANNLRGNPLPSNDTTKRTIGEVVFKPNLFMLAPPACNIFYPDEYASYNFSRNFFQEPTRLTYFPELPQAFQPAGVALPMVVQPQSFNYFMLKTGDPDVGTAPLQVKANQGQYDDDDSNSGSSQTNQGHKKPSQFLTNEERMKGILLATETVVPASSSFRTSLKDAGKASMSQRIARYLFFKKRFQPRSIQITSHLKMSVVPGFPVLILDDSDAEQHVLAYCQSVTHRIYSTQGGYTNTTLSYARTVGEQDEISSKGSEPPLPPWFDEAVFGINAQNNTGTFTQYSDGLSSFYEALLGQDGSEVITGLTGTNTVTAAVQKLVAEYRSVKSKGAGAIQNLISQITSRDYVTIKDAFAFLNASTPTKDPNTPFMEFFGRRISGSAVSGSFDTAGATVSTLDSDQIAARRAVIASYVAALKGSRGFRG